MSATRPPLVLGLVLCVSMAMLALAPTETASARYERPNPVGSDRFPTGGYYRGDFPDPAVLRSGGVYYAYSTTIASLNLPVMSSTDLVHWRVRGEGLRRPARWSMARRTGKRWFAQTWAPTVAQFGKRYVHAYAARASAAKDHRMCISISTSRRPWGRFVDHSRRPALCPSNRGAIDPQFFTGGRVPYLLWKREQTAKYPSELWSTPVFRNGTRLYPTNGRLLTTQEPWEGGIIENPSMIRYAGRYYLFYSGGSYADSTYATGYATCTTPLGPCTRVGSEPLLATGGRVAGPGGASAFLDRSGRLHLAYAAWDYGNTGYPPSTACLHTPQGCPQRRLHIATLAPGHDAAGTLVVTSRG